MAVDERYVRQPEAAALWGAATRRPSAAVSAATSPACAEGKTPSYEIPVKGLIAAGLWKAPISGDPADVRCRPPANVDGPGPGGGGDSPEDAAVAMDYADRHGAPTVRINSERASARIR